VKKFTYEYFASYKKRNLKKIICSPCRRIYRDYCERHTDSFV